MSASLTCSLLRKREAALVLAQSWQTSTQRPFLQGDRVLFVKKYVLKHSSVPAPADAADAADAAEYPEIEARAQKRLALDAATEP